ncbi:MAG: GAF domain-containing protein [bacterium]|nr:GAF domain-containing protein [bacterium]
MAEDLKRKKENIKKKEPANRLQELQEKVKQLEKAETEKEKALDALKVSEERYRKLVENVRSVVLQMDTRGKIVFINEYGEKLFQYKKEELIGKHAVGTIVPEFDRNGRNLREMVNRFLKDVGPHFDSPNENENITKDGTRLWMSWHNRAEMDEDGRFSGMLSVGLDITAQKDTKKKQQRLRKILQTQWDVAKMVDDDLKTICDRILEKIVELTDSKYGFYGFLNEMEDVMYLHAWSLDVMDDCDVGDKPIRYPIQKAGIWGDAVRKRQTVIINDYQSDFCGKLGLPDGHVSLTRVMSVPIFSGDKIVALGAVANKVTEYTKEDTETVSALLTNLQGLIERRKAEDIVQDSLKEKEILLKELHHRVKNNLATIISLLRIQFADLEDPKVTAALDNSLNRIRTMSLLHDKLYRSDNMSEIDASEYLSEIARKLFVNCRDTRVPISLDLQLESVYLAIDQAIYCGLMLNELITNSLRHAFHKSEEGCIRIELGRDKDSCNLVVSDNGCGMQLHRKSPSTSSLGMKLVEAMVKQLGGEGKLTSCDGTSFGITFPIDPD